MKWDVIRELFAFSAVVASLIFVGIEVQQNTAATRGQTRQDLTSLNQEWLTLLTADKEFAELFNRAWVKGGNVEPEEASRVEMMMVMNFRRQENVFFQYQEGLVDESALRSYGAHPNPGWFSKPHNKAWWSRWRSRFHPDFVKFIEVRANVEP